MYSLRFFMTGACIAGKALALVMLLCLYGSGALAAEQAPKQGGVLKIALLGLDTSDPHRHTGSIAVQQIFAESLTSIAADGSSKPFLAKSYTISPDGKVYTFVLREGVKFHNGRILTSADIVANIQRVKNTVSKGWLTGALKLISKMETPDDRQVVVHLKEPYTPFLNLLSELYILAPESPGWGESITLPIGTGPFMFGEWVPQVKLVAPKFKEYWMPGKPYLDGVEFDLRGSSDNSLALRAGDLHVARLGVDKAKALSKDAATVMPLKDTAWFFWAFNNRNPRDPLKSLAVRQAIAHTLDKNAYMKFVAGERGVVTNQMVAPGNTFFDKSIHDADAYAKPDLAKAATLLAAEGIKPETVTLELVSWQEPYAQVAVQMIKKAGFKVNHVALDDIGAQKRLGQYDWDVAVFSSGPRADIFLRYIRLMSDGPNPALWGGIQDKELDVMITKAVSAVTFEEQRNAYLEAWKLVMGKNYVVVIGHGADLIGVSPKVQGYDTGFTWSQHRVDGGVAFTWLQ